MSKEDREKIIRVFSNRIIRKIVNDLGKELLRENGEPVTVINYFNRADVNKNYAIVIKFKEVQTELVNDQLKYDGASKGKDKRGKPLSYCAKKNFKNKAFEADELVKMITRFYRRTGFEIK